MLKEHQKLQLVSPKFKYTWQQMKYILDKCRAINGAHIQNIIENETNTLLFLSEIILSLLSFSINT